MSSLATLLLGYEPPAAQPTGPNVILIAADEHNVLESINLAAVLRKHGGTVVILSLAESVVGNSYSQVEMYELNAEFAKIDGRLNPGHKFKQTYTFICDSARFFHECSVDSIVLVGDCAIFRQVRVAARLAGVAVFDARKAAVQSVLEHGGEVPTALPPRWVLCLAAAMSSASESWVGFWRNGYLVIRSVTDRLLAVILMMIMLPIVVAIGILRAASGHSLIANKMVVGKHNRPFTLYVLAPTAGNGKCLPSARWLWWIPSLVNVARGELSFVGPRLIECSHSGALKTEYLMAPGLIGWAQLNERKVRNEQKLDAMDQAYMLSVNILLDLKILLGSILMRFT